MGIYKHCGDLVSCPHCGAIHEIALSNCCCFEHDSKVTLKCENCGLYYSIIYYRGIKASENMLKVIG